MTSVFRYFSFLSRNAFILFNLLTVKSGLSVMLPPNLASSIAQPNTSSILTAKMAKFLRKRRRLNAVTIKFRTQNPQFSMSMFPTRCLSILQMRLTMRPLSWNVKPSFDYLYVWQKNIDNEIIFWILEQIFLNFILLLSKDAWKLSHGTVGTTIQWDLREYALKNFHKILVDDLICLRDIADQIYN